MNNLIPQTNFKYSTYQNSLLACALLKDPSRINVSDEDIKTYPEEELTKSIGLVSALYLYTNTPPHGYGTQAPKVAETLNRTFEFNKKKEGKQLRLSNGLSVERYQWEETDGIFPHMETHGNYDAYHFRMMAEKFLLENSEEIDACAEETIEHMLHTNADLLTKGRQTLDVMTDNSVTAARAYSEMYKFLRQNTGGIVMSAAEWIMHFISLFDKEVIRTKTKVVKPVKKRIYDRDLKMFVNKYSNRISIKDTEIKTLPEVRKYLFKIAGRFASYLKHKERGKKERRAIASANMVMRMTLYITEYFHLRLGKHIEGSTISIGGEDKKRKITSTLSAVGATQIHQATMCQGTEDATKWNECLSPSIFALMHKVFFDQETRERLSLKPITESGALFSKITIFCHFLQALKTIALGPGPIATSEHYYNRLNWTSDPSRFNRQTREWLLPVLRRGITDDSYAKASGGMLMGMLNATSTTLGLIPSNYRMAPTEMQVISLRSSDDSMTVYMGKNRDALIWCIETHRQNLSLAGINFSDKKTLFFQFGFGEYTSWYFQGDFRSQFGVETASLRPAAKNPADDFNAAAKGTATAQSTLTINAIGAEARLRIALDNIRRLWRIPRTPGKREGVSDMVLLLADGGRSPWTSTNCHLEETCLKERFIKTAEEKKYMDVCRNPNNPFAQEPQEDVTYSKELGCLTIDQIDVPRTIFHYVKRTNRTANNTLKKRMFEDERANAEVIQAANAIDPTTIVGYPNTGVTISKHLSSILSLEASSCSLSEEEKRIVDAAMAYLHSGEKNDGGSSEEEIDMDDL